MNEHPIHDLDDDVHQRVRLGILAALSGLARADFAHLKRELALTDGNLGRPRTWVAITAGGKKALRKEINALRKILSQVQAAESEDPEGPQARDPAHP